MRGNSVHVTNCPAKRPAVAGPTPRTYCQAWQVPAGWIAGSVLQNGGNFVNDNREPQGGSGNLYWQQLSAAQ